LILITTKTRVGVYIGRGPPPDDFEVDMAVDMTGRDIGVMISGSAEHPERVPSFPEIINALVKKYPQHKKIFESYNTLYEASGSSYERDGVLSNLGTWINDHLEKTELNLGIVKFTFKH